MDVASARIKKLPKKRKNKMAESSKDYPVGYGLQIYIWTSTRITNTQTQFAGIKSIPNDWHSDFGLENGIGVRGNRAANINNPN